MYDLVIRACTLPTCDTVDIAISDGVIVQIAPEILEPTRTEIDARGLHVLPGVVDAHVHFNAPGRQRHSSLPGLPLIVPSMRARRSSPSFQ